MKFLSPLPFPFSKKSFRSDIKLILLSIIFIFILTLFLHSTPEIPTPNLHGGDGLFENSLSRLLDSYLFKYPPSHTSHPPSTYDNLCPSIHDPQRVVWANVQDLICESVPISPMLKRERFLDQNDFMVEIEEENPFTVQQCISKSYNPSIPCNAFVLRVSRGSACDPGDIYNITSEEDESNYIKNFLGPDTFEISIMGTERTSNIHPFRFSRPFSDQDSKSCFYDFGIELKNPGEFRIQVNWLYENYDGFIESFEKPQVRYLGKQSNRPGLMARWPVMINVPLLQSSNIQTSPFTILGLDSNLLPFDDQLCPSTCVSSSFVPADQTHITAIRTITPPPDLSFTFDEDDIDYGDLPLCEYGPLTGHYIPDPTPQQTFPQAIEELKYGWVPTGCKFDESVQILLSDTESLSEKEKEVKRGCFERERKIALRGDSHVRMLYDALIPRLKGGGRTASYSKGELKEDVIGNVTFTYEWDTTLEGLSEAKIMEADTHILSTGAHEAFHHLSTAGFIQLIQDRANIIESVYRSDPENFPKVLFISTPAYPYRNDSFVWDTRDWRTPSRLSHWSTASLNVFNRLAHDLNLDSSRISLLDGFQVTLPFARSTQDSAHFKNTMAIEVWLQWTLWNMQLCR